MKVAECPCGWRHKAKSEEEIVREAQKHGKEAHGKTLKKEEVLSKVRDEK